MTRINEHPGYDQVSAFIDGELSASEMRDVEEHLTDCHACALRIVSNTRLKTATARAAKEFVAPPEAISRLAAQLRPQESQRETRPFFRFSPWAAACAGLVLLMALAGWWQLRHSSSFTAELLDQHLAVLSSGSTPEVLSSDRHTVKPWFQGKLPFSFNLPDTLPSGTTLKGGDLTFVHGQPAALLLFLIGKHQVSVFLTQRSFLESAPASSAIQSGFITEHTSTRDLRIIAVSDVNSSDLTLLVSALAKAQSPR